MNSTFVVSAMALDPSKGKRSADHKPGDDSAFVFAGLDVAGTFWIDADLDNVRDTSRIVEDGVALFRSWQPLAFAVEINQFQELLGGELQRVGQAAGLVLPLFGIVNSVNKQVRIRSLGPYLAQGRFRFRNTSGAQRLVQQLRNFPLAGAKDDGPDALEMAVRMIKHLLGERCGGSEPALLRV